MKRLIGKVCVFVTGLTVFMGTLPANGLYAGAAYADELSISQNGIDFICEKEGFSPTCYYDSSQSSIGYGTRCGSTAHSSGQHSITEEEAAEEMEKAINNYCIPNVRRQTEGIEMNQNQFDALVSFTYNTGGGTSMIKNSPLVKYLQGYLTEDEARSEYSSYIVTSGGKVLTGLINRRKSEADLFFGDVDSSSESGNKSENKNEAVSGKYIVSTKDDPLNMRKEAGTSSSIVTCVPKGATVNVSEINNGWASVSWNGYEGYCSMEYLKPADESSVSQYIIATKDDPLNMRKESSTSSSIVTRIPKGTKINVSEINNGWASVSWNGYEGYCSMTYLEKAE